MEVDGERNRYGFEVARFVEAADAQDAKERALAKVRQSPQWRSVLNGPNDPPRCSANEVELLGRNERAPEKQPGFAFYVADDEM